MVINPGNIVMYAGNEFRYVRKHRTLGYIACTQITGNVACVGTLQILPISHCRFVRKV